MCAINFTKNTAGHGGVFYSHKSNTIFTGNSIIASINNTAFVEGGVMYLTRNSSVIFNGNSDLSLFFNKAKDYGGVIYINLDGKVIINLTDVSFYYNKAASKENSFHINVQEHCNNTCLSNYIVTNP